MNLVDVRLSMGVRVLCRPSVWEASITHLCAGLSGSPWLGWLHFRGQTWFQSISHRIHGAGIYINIGAILMVNVTIYSSTMDPMGLDMRKKRGVYPQNNPTFPCSLETGDNRSKLLGTTWHKMKLIHILDVFPIDCTFDPDAPCFFLVRYLGILWISMSCVGMGAAISPWRSSRVNSGDPFCAFWNDPNQRLSMLTSWYLYVCM